MVVFTGEDSGLGEIILLYPPGYRLLMIKAYISTIQ